MDIESIAKSGGIGVAFAGIIHLAAKWLDRIKPKHMVKAEVGADYQQQIEFLNGEVKRLSTDVIDLRAELRANSKREHRLHLLIHKHCQHSPQCLPWFDTELGKLESSTAS